MQAITREEFLWSALALAADAVTWRIEGLSLHGGINRGILLLSFIKA